MVRTAFLSKLCIRPHRLVYRWDGQMFLLIVSNGEKARSINWGEGITQLLSCLVLALLFGCFSHIDRYIARRKILGWKKYRKLHLEYLYLIQL